jgi:hypothetical protein
MRAQSVVVQIRIEGVQRSSGGVHLEVRTVPVDSSRKKMTECQTVICELLLPVV